MKETLSGITTLESREPANAKSLISARLFGSLATFSGQEKKVSFSIVLTPSGIRISSSALSEKAPSPIEARVSGRLISMSELALKASAPTEAVLSGSFMLSRLLQP